MPQNNNVSFVFYNWADTSVLQDHSLGFLTRVCLFCIFFFSCKIISKILFAISDSAFKQQRLPAWQPILTAGTVLPTFFVIGIAFIPVGIGLLYFSDEVKEYTVDYTLCTMKNGSKCADLIQANSSFVCKCDQNITLTEDFAGTVFMYYGLTNFYQNHRY